MWNTGGACKRLASQVVIDQIIGHTVKVGLILDTSVMNAVITMYSKCGRISEARKIFDFLSRKDLVSWNAMIDRRSGEEGGRFEGACSLGASFCCVGNAAHFSCLLFLHIWTVRVGHCQVWLLVRFSAYWAGNG